MKARQLNLTKSLAIVSNLVNEVAIDVVVVVALMIILSFGLIRRRVVAPIQNSSQSMSRIAKGNYDTVVESTNLDTEIGDMARSVEILKDNLAERQAAESGLADANEELNTQLADLTDIRERAEARAAEAIGLAENLHFAKETADKATSTAKTSENLIRSLMNTVKESIITVDSKGCIETFNLAAQKIFRYDVEVAKCQNVSMLLPNPHKAKNDGYIKNFADGNPARIIGSIVEEVAIDKNGRKFPI